MIGQAGITLIVLLVVIVLYATEKLPLTLTAILSMLSVYFLGVLTFAEAFSGFANNAFIMVIGMSFFASAFSSTGLIDLIVHGLEKLFLGNKGLSEKKFILLAGIISAVMSMFLNPMLVTTIFMNIIDIMAVQPNSKITRRNTTFAISVASVYGSMFTSISATTVILTSSLLADGPHGSPLGFFEPAVLGIPCFLVYLLFYATFGCRLQENCFRFTESPVAIEMNSGAAEHASRPKIMITLGTLAACIGLFIFSDYALGAVAFAGAAVLVLTKCVDLKFALSKVNWSTAVLLAASIGFAKGVEVSGAGLMIANFLIDLAGPLASSPFGVCVLALIVSSLVSNFMSNSSTALILVPLFTIIAQNVGAPILPVVIAAGVGAGLATATPICTGHITLTTAVGYRFIDYMRVGGLLNLMAIVASAAALYLFYFI